MLPVHKSKSSVFNYDEIPPGYYYKAMHEGSAVQRFWHEKKFFSVAQELQKNKYTKVLDLGCGPGSFLSVIGERFPCIEGMGVDIASPQIDFAIQTIENKFTKIKFQKIDSERLPFPDESFDAVTSIEVIEHIHPYVAAKILAEARRVLKPGGSLYVTTPNYRSLWPFIEFCLERLSAVKYHEQHISKFTPNSLVKFLETCGFEPLRVGSLFILSPFLSPISFKLAQKIHQLEQKFDFLAGSLLLVEAKKITD